MSSRKSSAISTVEVTTTAPTGWSTLVDAVPGRVARAQVLRRMDRRAEAVARARLTRLMLS